MHKALEILSDYDIPTNSFVRAVQTINDGGELPLHIYVGRIEQLTDCQIDITDHNYARIVYLYLVQEIVRASASSEYLDINSIYELACDKATQFMIENKWAFVRDEETSKSTKLDALGQPKRKKGAKKELAISFYKQNRESGWTRKVWIEKLAEHVGLTPAGASTYYANLKAGRYK